MKGDFEKKRRDLSLPPGASLLPPPFFEGKGLRVEFQFETLEEYRSILSSLSVLPEKEEFQQIVEGVTDITSSLGH
jgi:hypothetical protein